MIRLYEAIAHLRAAGCAQAAADVRALFRHFEGLPDRALYGEDPVSSSAALAEAVRRRADGTPVAYLLGYADFFRERYTVTPDVLIPRPETEELVELAVARLPDGGRLLDLCTGSGCIALSTLMHTSNTQGVLVDLSAAALAVAERNACQLGLRPRVQLVRSDVLREKVGGRYELITSNPPYVNDDVYPTLCREIHNEPRMAFVGGRDGMDFYRAILSRYAGSLAEGGCFLLEIGFDQGERIAHLAREHGFSAQIRKDLSGHDRIALLTP